MPAVNVTVKGEGGDLTPKMKVVAVEASYQCHEIPRATLVVADGNTSIGKWKESEQADLEPGKKVEIKANRMGEKGSEVEIFKGIVTGQSLKASAGRSFLTVHLHGDLINLVEPRLTQIFPEKSKEGDIIGKLVEDAGATVKSAGKTDTKHTQLAVYDESAWSFVKYLAEINGFMILPGLDGVTIDEAKNIKGTNHKLKIDQFQDVNLNLDTTSAQEKVTANAWSVKDQKNAAPGKGASPTNLSTGKIKAKDAAAVYKRKEWKPVAGSPADAGTLAGWANGELLYRELDRYQGSMTLKGSKIEPGDTLEIEHFGKLFNGKHMVTGVSHRIDTEGWRTTAHIGLPITRTRYFNGIHKQAPSVRGLQIGQVQPYDEDKADDAQFRFKVKVPAFGEKDNIVWARLGSPFASKEIGLFLPPKPNDEVILGWFDNSPGFPVILGSMHNPKLKPPILHDKKFEKRGLIITKDAITFVFDEKEKTYTLTASDKVSIMLSEKDGNVFVQDKTKLILNKGVSIESDQDINLKTDTKINTESGGDTNIVSKANLNIETTADTTITATGNCNIEAALTEVK